MPPLRTPPGAWAPLLIVLALIFAATLTSAEEVVRGNGSGHWGPEGEHNPANATWLLLEDQVVGFHVATENGTRATCSDGNGTLTTPEGVGTRGACEGTLVDNQIILQLRTVPDKTSTSETRWNGTFAASLAGGTGDPSGFTSLELILGVGAAAALGASTVLAVFFVRERRLTGHLARRLYERSRGKRAHKHPDHSEEERVRRILVRSKN